MYLNSSWMTQNAQNAVRLLHRDAQDAKTNGIAQGIASLDNGKVISLYVI